MHNSRRKTALFLSALMLLPLVPVLPANARLDVGKDIEKGLGRMVADEIESTYGVVEDPLLAGWVNRTGQRLAAVSGRTDLKYSFKVLDSDEVNATAAPGGYIYVNRGTLRFIQSEDELAAVMGHEVGHVAGKHAMKQLNAQLIGTLALVGFQAIHAETLRTVGGLAGGLAMLKFSRDEENDADRRGLKNATATGYDGTAMITFFQRLQDTEKEKPSSLEVYFLTHPPTAERIRRVGHEPGTVDSAANAAAIGDGYAQRSLYRQAAVAYKRALKLDPDVTEKASIKQRLADAYVKIPQTSDRAPLSMEARELKLKQLASLAEELTAAQETVNTDLAKLAESQKDVDAELELTARSLATLSNYVSRRDTVQFRQFVRMARSFDQAAKVGGNLRSARDASDSTLKELIRLRIAMQHAVENGDGAAARQVDGLVMSSHALLQDLTAGLRQARNEGGDARQATKTLHLAADSLMSFYRSPLSLTGGQINILDLQVSTAQDSLHDSVNDSRKALTQISRSKLDTTLRRMNFITRSVPSDDQAALGIVAHYLGAEPSSVAAMRGKLELGDAALAVAQDQIVKYWTEQKRSKKGDSKDAKPLDMKDPKLKIQPENASVLFDLMVRDLEREIPGQ